jgi:hypothetical protein
MMLTINHLDGAKINFRKGADYSCRNQKLAGPAAEELGYTLQDSIRVYRFKRRIRLFQKIKEICKTAGIEPHAVPLKILLPSVEYASVEENDELQDRWAALLANAADSSSNITILPAFSEVLRQLNPEEVRFLDVLCPDPIPDPCVFHPLSFLPPRDDPWVAATANLNPNVLQLMLDNLIRLGIFRIVREVSNIQSGRPIDLDGVFDRTDLIDLNFDDTYELTRFGRQFLIACRAPAQKSKP